MSSYSVLLVDDEEFVFEVIMKKMNWEEMGFQVIGYARNGLEALEMAEENPPDVVLTDIRMPYMDGLTLCRKLKEEYPNIKVIIFSGFDDFEYAKEAIKLEVEEYILKPIDAEELHSVFERVKKTLDKERDARRNIDQLQEYYLNSLPMLQENFYVSLLEGRMPKEQISKYASDYQVKLTGPNFLVCIFHVSYHEKNGEEVEIAPFMLSLSVQKLVEEQLRGKWIYKALNYLGDLVIVTQLEGQEAMNRFTDHMDRICRMAFRVCNAMVTAGIGYMVSEPESIQTSYHGARNAISHRVLYGNMRAINIREVELKRSQAGFVLEHDAAHEIVKAIRLGEKEILEQEVTNFCNDVCGKEGSMQEYHLSLMKFGVSLLEFLEKYDLDIRQIFGAENDFIDELFAEDSTEGLKSYILSCCMKILTLVESRRQDTRTSFVVTAEDYVKEHYADQDLDIDAICRYLNVSSSYFSTTFKKDTGKTFINYLTDYRMEQSVRLLETTTCKTYEIAAQVGYTDPNYFSYAFKKKYGVSPSRYAAKKKKETS